MTNKEIVRRYWHARWNERDPDAVEALVTPDVSFRSPAANASGRAEFQQAYAALLQAFGETEITVAELIEEGDKVASRVVLRGVHSGDSIGFPATGRPFEVTLVAIFRLRDGRIAEEFKTYDALDLLTQLGMDVGRP